MWRWRVKGWGGGLSCEIMASDEGYIEYHYGGGGWEEAAVKSTQKLSVLFLQFLVVKIILKEKV